MPATLADTQAQEETDIEFMYKGEPPYMEEDNGIGYKGTVLVKKSTGELQCGECGKWFIALGVHLRSHKITAREYKTKHGLYQKDGLVSREVSRIMSETGMENHKKNKISFKKGNKQGRKKTGAIHYGRTIQYKNERALCDKQIEGRLEVVMKMAGKTSFSQLETSDIRKFDRKLYQTVRNRDGGFERFVGIDIRAFSREYDKESLIAKLRLFVLNNGFIPKVETAGRKNKLPSFGTYLKYFGSWERAKAIAGLHELLSDIKENKVVNMKPVLRSE